MTGIRRRGGCIVLKAGAEVEVKLDEPGFRGAWFEATILRSRLDRGYYSVVYESLADEADESRLLRENVAMSHVRPRPPRGGGDPFGVDQQVDAFSNDGWWYGVVARVPEGECEGKYVVWFPYTGDEMEFGAAELRPHLEWGQSSGKWVSPESLKLDGEATDDCKHSLSATSFPHKSKAPRIVRSSRGGDDGIRSGTSSEIKDSGGSTFGTQLESSQPGKKRRKREAIADNTRLIDLLVRSSKAFSKVKTGFNITMPTMDNRPNFHIKTFLVDKFPCSSSSFQEKNARSPIVPTEPHQIPFFQEVHEDPLLTPAEFIRESLLPKIPHIIVDPTNRGDELMPEVHETPPLTSPEFSQESLVPQTPHVIVEPKNRGDDLMPGGKGENDKKRKAPVTQDQPQEGKVLHDSDTKKKLAAGKKRRKSTPQKLRIINSKASSEGSKPKQLDDQNDGRVEMEHTMGEVDLSTIVDPICISRCDEESNHEGPPSIVNHEGSELKQLDGRSDGRIETEHRIGGVDLSTIVDSLCISRCDEESNHDDSPSTIIHEGSELKQLDGRNDGRMETEHTMGEVDLSTIVGSLCISRCDEESNHEDSPSAVSHKGDTVVDKQDILLNDPSMEGHSTSQIEATQGTLNLQSQHNESGSGSGSEAQNNSLSSSEKSCLPFEKHSTMWEAIDSMEVISKMQQQPHFRPLEKYCEVFREGMAIGLLVTYSNLMNTISGLKIGESHCKFDEYMKTLMQLEGHGFDIQHALDLLEEMLRIKNDHEQLLEKSSMLEVLVLEKEKEKGELNGEIENIGKVILDLEDALTLFYERKASLLKQQEENDSHIAKLTMEARVVEEGLRSAEHDFEGIIGSTW